MRTLEQLAKLCDSHPWLEDVPGARGTTHLGFLNSITEEEKQIILNSGGDVEVFWKMNRNKMLSDMDERFTKNTNIRPSTSIGDSNAPVNPDCIVVGDYIDVSRGVHYEGLARVVWVDNNKGILGAKDFFVNPYHGSTPMEYTIRCIKIFKRAGELIDEQAEIITKARWQLSLK